MLKGGFFKYLPNILWIFTRLRSYEFARLRSYVSVAEFAALNHS